MNTKAADAFSKARSDLLLDHFFFGRLAMFLAPKQDTSMPTLAVDGKNIFYNPEFFLNLRPDLRKSAVAHEVMHCVLEHTTRRKGRSPRRWNMAADFAINPMLKDSGMTLGQEWLFNPAYFGMSSEEIYNLLPEDSGAGDNPGAGGGKGDPLCDVRDAPTNGSDAELTSNKQEWAINVAQAAYEAKQRGTLPACIERFVDDAGTNKVPWREVLHRFLDMSAKNDYSWSRPNRMFAAAGVYLPSLHSEAMGPIDVVIDTSGSIGQDQLDAFGAEIIAISQLLKPERVRVIYADADVNHVDVFEGGEGLAFKAYGGGGTDFRPAIAYAADEPPVALVYLTDMYGAFPEHADFPVLWCATTDVTAPMGETVRMEMD